MVDINRFRYQNQLSNIIYSTCPVIPKYHSTFGEPIDRQEISSEFEQTKDADPKKGEAQKLMGRVDKIELDHSNDLYIVTDDYGFNVMYDSTFHDMRAVEQEILKIVSFYINKLDNTVVHGPGGQVNKHDLHNEADPCFGKIVEGTEKVIEEIDRIPTSGREKNFELSYPVVIISAKVMVQKETNDGWMEVKAGEVLDGDDRIMPLPDVPHGV